MNGFDAGSPLSAAMKRARHRLAALPVAEYQTLLSDLPAAGQSDLVRMLQMRQACRSRRNETCSVGRVRKRLGWGVYQISRCYQSEAG